THSERFVGGSTLWIDRRPAFGKPKRRTQRCHDGARRRSRANKELLRTLPGSLADFPAEYLALLVVSRPMNSAPDPGYPTGLRRRSKRRIEQGYGWRELALLNKEMAY